jgi:DNA-binding Xre family transcriptional regulator
MRKCRAETMFEKFELYYPDVADNVVEYEDTSKTTLRLYFDDGSVYSYHFISNDLRKIKDYDKTEESCRYQIAMRLKDLMANKGYDQKELAEKSGLSEAAISHYINQKRTLNYNTARLLAIALDCSVADFID